MRIAFVTPEFVTEPSHAGGLANYLGRLSVALVQHGHEVHVLLGADCDQTIAYRGVNVHRIVPFWDRWQLTDRLDPLVPRSFYNAYQDIKLAWSLWHRWRQLKQVIGFDLVQVANARAVGLFFRWERQVPVVARLSSYRPDWDRAAGHAVTNGLQLRWWLERLALRSSVRCYAPTHFVAERARQGYGLAQVDVVETPFFLEEPREDTAPFERHLQDQTYLLFFGRMTQIKGVHLLADALPEVLARFGHLHAAFIGGWGKAPDNRPMPDYIRERLAPFEDRLTLLGPHSHAQLYPFVRNARLVVLPSLMDNLPNACLEAMGLGKVVVATHGSCFEQLIEDGRSGILVPAGNTDALARGIELALQMSEAERQSMEQQARQSVAKLEPPQAIPRLVRYYRSATR